MQGLKLVVIGLGIAIVVMLAVIVATIADRAAQAPERLPRFDPSTLSVPPGARIAGITVGEGRAIVRLDLGDGRARLLVIDLASGRGLGVIDLVAEP